MTQALVLTVVLVAVVLLALLARRINVPYPIACVIGGIVLAFTRHIPRPRLDPDVIFLLVLPILLYSAGWTTDWLDFKRNIRAIARLSILLVIFTTVVVAVVAHALIPGFSWPVAFTLGAIVSPTDAVAAEAIFKRLTVPRRILAIVSGESLVNDATALVLYRFAILAVTTGTFVLAKASVSFVVVGLGGVAIGLAIAFIVEFVLRYINRAGLSDPTIVNVLLLATPYLAYLPAEHFHTSGILAAATAGITLNRRLVDVLDSQGRMIESAVWELLTFILNAFVFLLIGLELPLIVEGLRPDVMLYVRDAAIICALVIGIRMAWVYADRALPSIVGRDRGGRLSWPSTTIVGWAGMRGIVSLAAALAIPYDFALSDDHPIRAEVIFYTLCVAFVTVVGQGLTLAPLVRFLGVAESSASQREEAKIRIRALGEGMRRLRELEESCDDPVDLEIAGRVLLEYEQRIAQLQGRVDNETEIETDELRSDRLIQSEALEAERHAVARMRANGEIPDAIYNAIQYDLDLAALKLGKA